MHPNRDNACSLRGTKCACVCINVKGFERITLTVGSPCALLYYYYTYLYTNTLIIQPCDQPCICISHLNDLVQTHATAQQNAFCSRYNIILSVIS